MTKWEKPDRGTVKLIQGVHGQNLATLRQLGVYGSCNQKQTAIKDPHSPVSRGNKKKVTGLGMVFQQNAILFHLKGLAT